LGEAAEYKENTYIKSAFTSKDGKMDQGYSMALLLRKIDWEEDGSSSSRKNGFRISDLKENEKGVAISGTWSTPDRLSIQYVTGKAGNRINIFHRFCRNHIYAFHVVILLLLSSKFHRKGYECQSFQNFPSAKANRGILKRFFGVLKGASISPLLRFVFLTGVFKFSRVSIFSELNNLAGLTRFCIERTRCGPIHRFL
jgi:hypothetical protein